jgi:hypothetical protein
MIKNELGKHQGVVVNPYSDFKSLSLGIFQMDFFSLGCIHDFAQNLHRADWQFSLI